MAFLKQSGGGPLTGLDIGRYCVKALELRTTRTGREIKGLARKELPPKMRQGRRDPKEMVKLIQACLAEGGIAGKDVVIMVSGSQVFVRRVTMPPMPEDELAQVIPFEAAKYVSFPVEQLSVDYIVVGEKEVDGVKNLDILLVAIPKDVVESEMSVVRAAGLRPVAVTVAPMAMWKSLQLSGQAPDGKIMAMLDIGFERSTISLLHNGVLGFTRTINLGGDEVTKSMTVPFVKGDGELHTLTYDEAEAIKREYGFPLPSETGTTNEGVPLNQISILMRPVLERLLGEVRASFDFYATEFQIPGVDKIIISGGGAALKGLQEFLSGDLGVDIELANPFQGAVFTGGMQKDNFAAAPHAFTVPFGLAAWGKGDLSLLGRRKIKQDTGIFRSLAIPGGVAFIIMISLYWSVSGRLAETGAELDKKTREIASLKPISTSVLMLSSKKKKLEAEINALPQALRESIDPVRIQEEIRLATPDNMRLEQVLVNPRPGERLIRIWGTVFFLDERGPAMSDFMTALENSPLFDDVRMLSVEENKNYTVDGLRFLISCQYIYTGG